MSERAPSKTRKKIEWLLRRAEGLLLPDALRADEGAHLGSEQALASLRGRPDEVAQVGAAERLATLERAASRDDERRAYVERWGAAGVERFAAGGARIYMMAVETFPRHVNNVYLVVENDQMLLFDCGSGWPTSRRDLALAFAVIRSAFGEPRVRYEDVDVCLVSHAHMDHFGGANLLKEETRAALAVHELDARVLACFDERLVVATKDIDVYWQRAGVPDDVRPRWVEMYGAAKQLFRPQDVDVRLRDGDRVGAGYVVHHVPGHCPGLLCLQVHDVLLTSDHVLARITPHQFPQAITPFGGLEHYFHSLAKIRRLEGIRLALGGHEEPIPDLRARIDEIEAFHRERLDRVLEVCATPHTVVGVTRAMFGDQEGYGELLAIEEAGAHVEYLHQLGRLRIANLDDVARAREPVIEYVAR